MGNVTCFTVTYYGLCLLHGLHVTLRVHVTFDYLSTLHGFTCECCLLLFMSVLNVLGLHVNVIYYFSIYYIFILLTLHMHPLYLQYYVIA